MSNSKATAGYRSRREAILALSEQGLKNNEIAGRLGTTRKNVSSVLWHDRQREIPALALQRLAPHAEKRGITAHELGRQLISIIARDGLVDAILDDRQEAAE